MTNAEAIKQLRGMVVGAEWLSDYMVEALDMAIEALSSGKDTNVPSMEEFMYGQDIGNPEDGSL